MFGAKSTAFAAAMLLAAAPISASAQEATHEITVTVLSVQNLDKADELSRGDDFARVKIGSQVVTSPTVSSTVEFKPNWVLSAKVPAGKHDVKLELIDKDLSVDDPIDINRIDKKRDLDFSVDTATCKISGFAQSFKCGSKITRAGLENKKAKITFSVSVSKIKK